MVPEIAKLRVEVFAEYPFLYRGDYEYEKKYLKKFSSMKDAIVVTAFDDETLVGVSTGFPFIYEAENLQQVLKGAGKDPKDYFCFGESVLKKTYRKQGIGSQFMKERELHVKKLKTYKSICFYTALRSLDDPKRPAHYQPLNGFWEGRGFIQHPELVGEISYQEIGEEKETPKKMVFWIKKL